MPIHATSSSDMTSNQEGTTFNINGRSESLVIPISKRKLSENNYLQWSHSIMLSVCRKRKDDFFTGATTALSIEDPKYKV